ncbi:MAG: hypothetical protein Q8N68_02890, partial [bacterium]|nr:hypothetical protein [bacterium]
FLMKITIFVKGQNARVLKFFTFPLPKFGILTPVLPVPGVRLIHIFTPETDCFSVFATRPCGQN